jgi:hypothetical protein
MVYLSRESELTPTALLHHYDTGVLKPTTAFA